jgi:uncharacterized protein YyaL (SSP411 family)
LGEIKAALGEDAPLFCEYFNVEPHGTFEGKSVLYIHERAEEFAARKHLDPEAFAFKIDKLRKQLLETRNQERTRPTKDDKVLVGWNGLMIYSLVNAGRAFGDQKYLNAARKAAVFIKNHLWKDGHLLRRWRAGEARFSAGLDEYAFMIHALLSLFEEDGSVQWLSWAMEMADVLKNEYKLEDGAFYLTDGTDPHLVLRRCEFYDGSEPSGNGSHCENLLRLYQITFDEEYLRQAEDGLKAVTSHLEHHPIGCCYYLLALQRYYDKHASTIIIALNEEEEYVDEIKELLFTHYNPHHSVVWKRHRDQQLAKLAPALAKFEAQDNRTTVYICQKGQCQQPLIDWTHIVMGLTNL